MVKKAEVLQTVKDAERPLSANEIAERAEVDWHTAKKHLMTLVDENEVYKSKMSDRLTLYWHKEIPF